MDSPRAGLSQPSASRRLVPSGQTGRHLSGTGRTPAGNPGASAFPDPAHDVPGSATERWWALAIAGAAFALYLATLAPGVLYGDPAKFQTMAWSRDLGFYESAHPLWVLLMHPVAHLPGVTPAFACNLGSAFFSALALWPAWRIARRLGASRPAAATASLALAVSHTYWLNAVITEVYALNNLAGLCLLDAVTAAAMGKRLRRAALSWGAIGLAAGLAGANHGLVLLWLPGLVWLVVEGARRGEIGRAGVAAAAAGLAGTMGVFAFLRILDSPGPAPWTVAIRLMAASFTGQNLAGDLAAAAGFFLYQFTVPVMIAAFGPGCRAIPPRVRWPLLLMLCCSVGFALRYPVKDRFVFFQPAWLLFSVIAAPGLDTLNARLQAAFRLERRAIAVLLACVCVAAPPAVYAAAIPLARRGLMPVPAGLRDLPGRDETAFYLFPGKGGEDGPRRHAEALLDAAPPRAVMVADHSLRMPMKYLHDVEGRRPDVVLAWTTAPYQLRLVERRLLEGRPVCLAATDTLYDVAGLTGRFTLVPIGPITCVEPRGATPAGESGSS